MSFYMEKYGKIKKPKEMKSYVNGLIKAGFNQEFPYFIHPLEVAYLVFLMFDNPKVVAAAVLVIKSGTDLIKRIRNSRIGII